jgi:signal transduction protein with GAF and PtsI domain
LLGRALVSGLGIGRAELVPTAESLSRGGRQPARPEQLEEAFDRIGRDLARLRGELAGPQPAEVMAAMARLELLLSDGRFRDRALAPGGRLGAVAREYARAPFRVAQLARMPERVLVERAEDVSELCALLDVIATGGRLLQSGRVWIGRRMGGFFALAAARGAAAVVLDGDGEATEEAVAILRAAGVPLLVGVRGLFAWSEPGDLMVVDADRSLVRVNPSYGGVAAARARLQTARS